MRKVLTAAVAGAAIFVATASANATEWWFLNWQVGQCQPGSTTPYPSPYALHTALRQRGETDNVQIARFPNGSVSSVTVTIPDKTNPLRVESLTYFTSFHTCEAERKAEIARGRMPNPKEMQ